MTIINLWIKKWIQGWPNSKFNIILQWHNKKILFAGLCLLVTFCIAISLGIDSINSKMNIWDNFIPLEGGWRIIQGQTPHVDFHSPLGPFIYYLTALGLTVLKDNSLIAITLANALILPFIFLAAWSTSYKRLSFPLDLIYCLIIIGLTIAIRPLGGGRTAGSYSSIYNRYGYIFLMLALTLLFVPKNGESKKLSLMENALLVILFVLLAINKITFFLVVVPCLFISNSYFFRSYSWIFKIFLGCIFTFAVFFLVTGIPFSGLINDYYWGRLAFNPKEYMAHIGARLLINDYASFLVVFVCGLVVYFETKNYLFIWSYLLFSSLFLYLTTGQSTEIPLNSMILLILTSYLPINSKTKNQYVLLSALILLSCIPLIQDYRSLYYQFTSNPIEKNLVFHGMSMEDSEEQLNWSKDSFSKDTVALRISAMDKFPPGEFKQILLDGVALLKKHLRNTDRVFSFEFYNSFPFLLSGLSPKGNLIWWDKGKSISSRVPLEANELFDDVTVIMYPKRSVELSTLQLMQSRYGAYLDNKFELIEESTLWKLYRKRVEGYEPNS